MSKLLITKYHNRLHEIFNSGGTRNETSITFAFANLLRSYAEKKGLLLVEQFEFVGKSGKRIRPDGVLKYFGGIDVGYWEAKDTKDKLDVEINKKLNEAGYPNKNIIFEDTNTAVLIQEGAEVMRVSMREWNLLDDLLDKFINYEPSEVKEFNKALEQFKENVPTIVEGLRELMEREAETKLRADKVNNTIEIDSHSTLTGIPALAWEYKLGNRSALEWILDQYKEKKPSDATIAERFNTYKFEDYKEQAIDLLKRVCNVSLKTMEIVNQMPNID